MVCNSTINVTYKDKILIYIEWVNKVMQRGWKFPSPFLFYNNALTLAKFYIYKVTNLTKRQTMAVDEKFKQKLFIAEVDTTEIFAYDADTVHTSGDETINGSKTFTSDIQGTAVRAKWADLAECYLTDKEYPKGTLLQFGGAKELTLATTKVNAVVSSKPGFILNDGEGTPVCLSGRVEVRVIGSVKKFDHLVLSSSGVATVDNIDDSYFATALQSNDDEGEKLVLCACQLKL